MDDLISEVLAAGADAYRSKGWLALAAVACTYALRLYREFGGEASWQALPPFRQRLIVAGLGLAGSLAVAVSGGTTWQAALLAALPVALTALVTHKGTQLAGRAVPETGYAPIDTSIRVAFDKARVPPPPGNVVAINKDLDAGL